MLNRTTIKISIVFALATACAACPADKPAAVAAPDAAPTAAPVAPAVDAAAAEEAKQIYATRCTPCHGATGAGDGPGSAALTPKPASFASKEWQAQVTDEHIEKVIAYGGMAVGKSAAMPPNPDLDGKPVVPALRALVRGLKAP